MTFKKVIALAMAATMALSLAACGAKEEPETTAASVTEEAVITQAPETQAVEVTEDTTAVSEDASAPEEESDVAESTTEAAGEFDLSTTEGVVEFYKAAAVETDKNKINAKDVKTLKNLDGGAGIVGAFIGAFEPIAKRALEKNSGDVNSVTGGYEKLTAADVSSATAKDDGKYTTVTIKLKDLKVGMVAPEKEGSVGHGITTLGSVQDAIDELDGVTIDTSEGAISLTYTDATINVKVDNATGKIVSGTWSYDVNVDIDNVKAGIGFMKVTLKGAKGVVGYTITL